MARSPQTKPPSKKRTPNATRAKYPRHSVERALRIPKAILDQNAGKPVTPEEAAVDELYGFLEQSHISQKNIDRLGILTRHADPEVRKLADLVLDIARVKPYRRRRLKFLAKNDRSLLLRLLESYGDDLPDMFGPIDDYL
jgi:hypothetical protein